jgi:N-acetylmuramoyl-L-alanine amidase
LYQNAYLDQSVQFAGIMQQQFANKLGRHSRGVKQAGFLVLYKTTMPGALIEIGFISNAAEEEYIGSENGKTQIANGIFRAFKAYKLKYEEGVVDNTEVPDVDTTETFVTDNKTNGQLSKIDSAAPGKKEIFFRVQFYTSPAKKVLNSPEFKGLADVRVYSQNNTYKYTSGNYNTLTEAAKYLDEVHNKGFKDAFVVAFVNEQRISPSEATKLLSQEKGQ